MDKHQELMDEAYDRWKKGGDLENTSRIVFLDKLTTHQRMAVVLGNMNYQVENGGWNQWVDNGYCTSYPHLMDALETLGTDNAKKIITMLDTIGDDLRDDVISGTCNDGGCGGTYFNDDKYGEQEEDCYNCNGEGTVSEWNDDTENDEDITCEQCGGDGVITEEMSAPDYDELTSKFYDINDKFMEECNEFLSND